MTFARNLIQDLIGKRLWPLALLLVAVIVAVPLLLGGDRPASTPTEVAVSPTPAAAEAASPIKLVGPASVRTRSGKLVDPFRRSAKSTDAESTSTTTPAGADAGSSGGATTGGSDSANPTPPGDQPVSPSRSVYRTTVRWSSNATPEDRRIARLTPLGGVLDPALLYLGVAPDGKHALFLLGPNAVSSGEAGCLETMCRIISLRRGQSQIVDLKPGGGEPRQFELKLVSVERDELSSAAVAAKARAKEHPDGRDVLRTLIEHRPTAAVIGDYGYDTDNGVMVRIGDQPATGSG